jgi:uncharacterized protein
LCVGKLITGVKLLLSVTILLEVNIAFCASHNDAVTEEKFIPDELILENCLDKETIKKISQIDGVFKHLIFLKK